MIRPATTPPSRRSGAATQQADCPALERQWKEDLGGPEAPETAIGLQKTYRLPTRITGGKHLVLAGNLGNAWVEANVQIANLDGVLAQWLADRPGATV